jgi:hypothetical protein
MKYSSMKVVLKIREYLEITGINMIMTVERFKCKKLHTFMYTVDISNKKICLQSKYFCAAKVSDED